MGNSACTPSPETVNCLYEVAGQAGILPDITLDPTLTTLLSLNSTSALEQQYAALQQNLSSEQLTAFNRDLTSAFGGSTKVSYGGVGVVALTLSLLFEVLAHQIKGLVSPLDPIQRIFGADTSSQIATIVSEYLKQVSGIANNQTKMAEVLELYDKRLKYELLNFMERMLMEQSMSSAGMKQWLNGAAFHVHMRIHGDRLRGTDSVSESRREDVLSHDYLQNVSELLLPYRNYLARNIQETPASPGSGPQEGAPSQGSGLLVVEPLRNVSHRVQHRPCEAKALGETLLVRIIAAQNLQHIGDFFVRTEKDFDRLVKQQGDFLLKS